MDDLLHELQATLHHEIPLSHAMGIVVDGYDSSCLTLKAPLAANINHKDTAFAGSLNALATLTGWSLIWLLLRERGDDAQIIIQESRIQYLLPVPDEFAAQSCHPPDEQVERFLHILQRRGKARLDLTVQILREERVAVLFHGRYIAHRAGAFD